MPIYEYKCTSCEKKFEEIVTGTTEQSVACPSCKSKKIEKLMSAIGGVGRGSAQRSSCGTSCPSAAACGSGSCCSQFS